MAPGSSGPVSNDDPVDHRRAPAPVLLGAVITGWIVVFAVLAVRRQDRFGSAALDTGLYDQAIWLLAHGKDFITVRGLPVFGHHANPAFYLLVPAYWLGAGANFINVIQVVALGLGAIPLYLLGRDKGLGAWPSAALGSIWLLHPATQFFAWEQFHPETMAITPLLAAYLCAERRSWRWFAFWIVFAVSWKEDVAIAVAMLGLVVAIRGDRKIGFLTAGAAIAYFFFVMQVLLPAVSGHPAAYGDFYAGVGGSASGVLKTMFTDPRLIAGRVFSDSSAAFTWKMLAPFGVVPPLFAPITLLIGLPQFFLDLVSDVEFTRTIVYRYAALPLVAIALAAVEGAAFGVRRLGSRARVAIPAVMLACAVAATLAWGPSPIGAEYDAGYWPPAHDRRLGTKEAAIARIPADASVSATYSLLPHLAHRDDIFLFPNPFESRLWGYRDQDPRDPNDIEWVIGDTRVLVPHDAAKLRNIVGSNDFKIVFDRAGIVVAQRVRAGSGEDPSGSSGG